MIFLEVAMIVIGLGAIIYSLRNSSSVKAEDSDVAKGINSNEDTQRESMRMQSLLDSFTTKAETVCDNLEDKMNQLSNEKIMGISEYSDQVLEKIQKNHEEVVFLYDMMNEKQEELKNLVQDVDSQKAELRDEAAKEYQKMKEQEQILDELKKNLETDILQFQSEQKEFRKEFEKLQQEYTNLSNIEETIDDELDADFRKLLGGNRFDTKAKEEAPEDEQPVFDSSVFDAEIARIEEEETKEREVEEETNESSSKLSSSYVPMSEQPEVENHNDEIISLYKKGRSVLEISKMLSLGQGEVKFVIDLYNAR